MTPIAESEVQIWYRGTAVLDYEAIKSAGQHLSVSERVRRDQLYFREDRRDYVIAHDLLRRALSRHAEISACDWQFVTNKCGKPSIVGAHRSSLTFSLSHTREYVACAIASNAPIGVDIERTDRALRVHEIADLCFSEEEAASLRQYSGEMSKIQFAELWTLKEAFLKALGVGLLGSLASVSFRLKEPTHIEFAGPSIVDPHEWHFALFEPDDNVRLGVAIQGIARPQLFVRRDQGDGSALAPIRVSK